MLVEYGLTADKARHLPAVKVAIAEIVTQVTEQQVARAQAMLLKMVNYESNRLLDALTLGGIAGQAGTVDLHEWEEQDLANRLAGGDDLANASSRSALLFTAKVEEIFTALHPTRARLLSTLNHKVRAGRAVVARAPGHHRANHVACRGQSCEAHSLFRHALAVVSKDVVHSLPVLRLAVCS